MKIPTAWKPVSYIAYYGGQNKCTRLVGALASSQEASIWVDAFAGSGTLTINREVLFLKKSVMIEKSRPVCTMHKVLKDKDTYMEFIERVCKIEMTKSLFQEAYSARGNGDYEGYSEMDIAIYEYILRTNCYSGIMGSYVKKNINYNNRYTNLLEIHDRYQNCDIINGDSLPDIKKYAQMEEAFLVLDPPFMKATRASTGQYDHEYEDEQHEVLLDAIKNAKADIILMGYDKAVNSDEKNLYDIKLRESTERQWYKFYVEKEDMVSKVEVGSKRNVKNQCMWINFYPHYSVRNNFAELDSLQKL